MPSISAFFQSMWSIMCSILKLPKRPPIWLRKYDNWLLNLLSDLTDLKINIQQNKLKLINLWVQGQPDLRAPEQQGLDKTLSQKQTHAKQLTEKSHLGPLHQIQSWGLSLFEWVWSALVQHFLTAPLAFGIIMSNLHHSWKDGTHCLIWQGLQLGVSQGAEDFWSWTEYFALLTWPYVGCGMVVWMGTDLIGSEAWILGPHAGDTT